MNKKKIGLFLLFAFGISWLSTGVSYVCGVQYGTPLSVVLTAVFYMGAPAIAAVIVQKWIYKQPIKIMGLAFREFKGKRFFRIPLVYLLFCVLWLGVVALLGNVFHIQGFGSITFEADKVLINLNQVTSAMSGHALTKMPMPPVVMFSVLLVTSFLAGIIVNTIFTLGEELGWRGFLYNEMQAFGFWKSNMLIGIIWGLWHAPLILQGHNFPEHRVSGVFMMVLFCVPLSYIMAYFRAKTNSALAPAIFHASINAVAGNMMLFSVGTTDIIGSIAGVSGAITCVLVFLLIIILDKKAIEKARK